MVSFMIKVPLATDLYMYYWWKGVLINGCQMGWSIGKVYFSSLLFYINVVDEALYGIVWYDSLMVEVFTLLSLHMLLPWPWIQIDEYMNMCL